MAKRVDLKPSASRQLANALRGVDRRAVSTQTAPPGVKDLGERGDMVWAVPTGEVDADGNEVVVDHSVKDEAEKLIIVSEKAKEIADQLATLEPAIDEAHQAAEDALAGIANALYSSSDEWAVSDSTDTPPTSGWSTETPEWHEGLYIWQRTTHTYGDGHVEVQEPIVLASTPGAAGEDAAVLRIDSSRGTAFKNNAISTVLSVTVMYGSKQIANITDLWAEFGQGAYLEWWWRRINDTEFGVISSSDDRLSAAGFKLTVSPDDVDEQTVFQCVLHT